MPTNAVVIVESPAKAKTIEGYLGAGYKVLASYGHIRDLPSKEGAVDTENDFAMKYVVQPDSEKNVKAILTALKNADTLYLATDLDREGEAISWHVWQEIKSRQPGLATKLNVHRIEFAEITKSAIQHAIAHPRELALNLINAQQARRALDYLVGFNLSPVLWRKVRRGLSAGRVQSVALRLICEREDAIEAFKPEEYWSIHGHFLTPAGKPLPTTLAQYNGQKVEKFSFTSEATATTAQTALASENYTVTAVEKTPKNRYPAAPFITSTLQQEASRKLGFGARRTMNAAQRLYEAGHITYMRTDSVALAAEAVNKIRAAIAKIYGEGQMPSAPITYKSKSKNAQEAHEAVRPTDPFMHPSKISAEPDQQRLYELIWQRTMACQMAPAKLEQTTIMAVADSGKHSFRATGSVVVFPGFLSVYQEGKDDNETGDDDDALLPAVAVGDKLATRAIEPIQHFTEPPPRFSEASLVKALEEYGIGRPSTYASIISTLQDREYVKLEKKRFMPEHVGRVVSKFLTEHFSQYVDYNFTAGMEEDLDAIARGEHDWKPTLRNFWQPFKALVDDKTENVKKSDVTQEATGESCPECQVGELVYRLGRYGRFKGCNRYPECTYIEKKETAAAAPGEDTGLQCPQCKAGNMVKRTSRRGIVFYSCSTYPTCTYSCWDPPIAETCPSCQWPQLTLKTTKRYGEVKKCAHCNWWSNEEAKAASEAFKARFAKKPAKGAKGSSGETKTKAAGSSKGTAKPKTATKAKAASKTKAPAKSKTKA